MPPLSVYARARTLHDTLGEGDSMGQQSEGVVLDFIKEFECPISWDDAEIERIVTPVR